METIPQSQQSICPVCKSPTRAFFISYNDGYKQYCPFEHIERWTLGNERMTKMTQKPFDPLFLIRQNGVNDLSDEDRLVYVTHLKKTKVHIGTHVGADKSYYGMTHWEVLLYQFYENTIQSWSDRIDSLIKKILQVQESNRSEPLAWKDLEIAQLERELRIKQARLAEWTELYNEVNFDYKVWKERCIRNSLTL